MTNNTSKPTKRLLSVTDNWIGLMGTTLSACSLLALLILLGYDLLAGYDNPYVGVIVYMVLPGALVAGLLLVLLGIHYQHRLLHRGEIPHRLPRIDLNDPRHRRNLILGVCAGFLFLLFSAFGSFRAYHVTESVAFCGLLCHQVMEPEHTAYVNSPHARLRCTECHIGPGAEWFVRAKISGLRQVWAVLTNSYSRPIPVPVENLRPARGTCEQCHWPDKFYGALELRHRYHLSDPANTPFEMRMLLKVGGANPQHGPIGGIHWHMAVGNEIEYVPADETRQTIPWVRATNLKTGKVTTYRARNDSLPAEKERQPTRKMDCIDCHNRPTHIFKTPNDAVDLALWLERIDPSIPSIKLHAAQALVEGANADTKAQGLDLVADFLASKYPDAAEPAKISKAIAETQDIFRANFFPEMKTDWRVRPDNIGHKNWPGCFRCHDGEHVSEAGETITADCNACHVLIAQGTGEAAQTIDSAGLAFDHPGGELYPGVQCNLCHRGAP